MSNSIKMTLEEKLVDRIKTTELASLIDDEDAIVTLTQRALTEALFNERKETVPGTGTYGNPTTKIVPSAVQQAARNVVEVAINALMADLVAKVLSNPETIKAMNQAILELLPTAILRNLDQQVVSNYRASQMETMHKLQMIFNQAGDSALVNAVNNVQGYSIPGPHQPQTHNL